MSVQVPVYILAGGRSSRFGSDKARAALHGRPMIVRIAELLRPVAESMIVVAEQSDKYADLGLLTIADAIPGQGPLADWSGRSNIVMTTQGRAGFCCHRAIGLRSRPRGQKLSARTRIGNLMRSLFATIVGSLCSHSIILGRFQA